MEHVCQSCRISPAQFSSPNGTLYCSVSCQVSQWLQIKGKEGLLKTTKTNDKDFSLCSVFGRPIIIPLSQIICGQFRIGPNWAAILSGVECTTVGSRVATSLVRVAATRIFADPTQSVLEPVVNSLDAYYPEKKTGKFGMGFFSLLYWVIQSNATVFIESHYLQENGTTLCGYEAKIWKQGGEVVMLGLSDIELRPTDVTGTKVTVSMPITPDLLLDFRKQLAKLKYVTIAPILVNGERLNPNAPQDSDAVVTVQISQTEFSVQDIAAGISRDVLLRFLVVPTVSTKTIQMSGPPPPSSSLTRVSSINPRFIPYPHVGNGIDEMVILVNSVAVMNFSVPALGTRAYQIVIDLPPFTRIPVSRDDVLLDSVQQVFEENIEQLWRLSMQQDWKTVVPLERLLDAFILRTGPIENKIIIAKVIQNIRKRFVANVIYVDNSLVADYVNIQYLVPEKVFVASQQWDPLEIEKWARSKWNVDDSYFMDRGVIFYLPEFPTARAFTGGLSGLIFVPSTLKEDPLFAENLATSFYEATLYPRVKEEVKIVGLEDYNLIEQSHVSRRTKSLLHSIQALEETCIRVGWSGDLGDARSWLTVCMLGAVSDDTLQFLISRLFPVLIKKPLPSEYGEGTTYQGFVLNGDDPASFALGTNFKIEGVDDEDQEYASLINIVDEFTDYAKKIPKWTKTLQFCADATKRLVLYTLEQYDKIEMISFDTLIITPMFPLLQRTRALKSWPGYLLAYVTNECKTVEEFYCCYTALGSISKKPDVFFDDQFTARQMEFMARTLVGLVRRMYNDHPDLKMSTGGRYSVEIEMDDEYKFSGVSAIIGKSFLDIVKTKMDAVTTVTVSEDETIRSKPAAAYIQFTLNEFIAESFRRNWRTTSMLEFFEDLREIPRGQELATQMIEIAVNEGTTKDVIYSQLTETIQNSVDAIRQFNPQNKNVAIDVNISKDNRHLLITIEDFVGIDPSGIVAMTIPFYSNKSASDIVAGEMGTGFFNVYRSTRVRIVTTLNGHRFVAFDEPIYYENTNRVKDVLRHVSYRHDPMLNNGTEIIISTRYQDEESLTLAYHQTKQFVEKVIGLVRFPDQGACWLNNVSVTKNLQLITQTKGFEVFINNETTSSFPSYIMTKGIPFAPMIEYVLSMDLMDKDMASLIANNCVINFRPGSYTPVQTRTKIGFSQEGKNEFTALLTRQSYLALLRLSNNEMGIYFTRFSEGKSKTSDTSDIEQVIPSPVAHTEATALKSFAMDYALPGLPSFRRLLHHIYAKWKALGTMRSEGTELKLVSPELKRIQVGLNADRLRIPGASRLLELAFLWFEGKHYRPDGLVRKESLERQIDIQEAKTETNVTVVLIYNKIIFFLQSYIQLYIEMGKDLAIFSKEREVPAVIVSGVGFSSFSSDTNTIHIRVEKEQREEYLNMIGNLFSRPEKEFLAQLIWIESTRIWQDELSPNGVISHELEHYRRNSSHDEGFHETTDEYLPFGGKKPRDFKLCHGDVMRSIIAHGFWSKLYYKFKEWKE